MLFNSFSFAIFLPIVFAVYWLVPKRFQWAIMFVASYYFYMSWNVKYVFLILFTTVISYITGILVEKESSANKKKLYLILALVASLGVLFFFKYFNFFSNSITDFLQLFSIKLNPITLKVMLPVGISFYTFQTLSYVIDVYKGDAKAEYHFGKYATFISFFPQLVAGPIERTQNLMSQIKEEHSFDYNKATYGLRVMAWGFFKKMAIADSLAVYVDKIYDNVYENSGFSLVVATVFFAIQIYCDFSGYSDIALGTAKLFGIDLMQNFKSPYFSSSVKELWSRWHISLSTWFRDYVYIPLGGNRVSKLRHKVNLIITFLVSGLWHGANWNFVIWGGLHGVAQVVESVFLPKNKKFSTVGRLIRIPFVFAFTCFAWIFFRAQTFSEALFVIKNLFSGITTPVSYVLNGYANIGMPKEDVLAYLCVILILAVFDYTSMKQDVYEKIGMMKMPVRWLLYFIIVWLIIFFTPVTSGSEFIYFQF